MKNYTILFLCFFVIQSFAQETKKETKEQTKQEVKRESWQSGNYVKFDAQLRIYLLQPIQFGNNALSKAHDSKPGVGINMSFLNIQNFKIGAGYNFESYKITDKEIMGNFNYSNYSSVFANVNYETKITENISFHPNVGIGHVFLKQKSPSVHFKPQEGVEYRIGFVTDYKFNNTVSLFFGANYIYSKYKINTAPEYEKFFGNSQKLQLSIGLQIE